MKSNYKIFVVFHKELNLDYYSDEMLDKYIFINVNPQNNFELFDNKFKILNLYEFQNFIPIGKWYTESEVIYNVYKNPYLWEDLDYIGFSQYDIDTSKLNAKNMNEALNAYDHINFQPHLFEVDYARNVVMDINKPNRFNGRGINCYDVMLKEYNDFYKTNFLMNELVGKTLNLCSAFVFSNEIFDSLMNFVSPIIESGKLDVFDTSHKNRMQGGYLERYYALWLALRNTRVKIMELDHHFIESVKGNTLSNKIKDKLRKWF